MTQRLRDWICRWTPQDHDPACLPKHSWQITHSKRGTALEYSGVIPRRVDPLTPPEDEHKPAIGALERQIYLGQSTGHFIGCIPFSDI